MKAILAALILAASTLSASAYSVKVTTNVVYGPNTLHRLDTCTPIGLSGTKRGIVLIHGGGFTNGSKERLSTVCKSLAATGFVVANINYRLLQQQGWPNPGWEQMIGDAQLAMRWLRAHADEYSIDQTKVCAYGHSAGGHITGELSQHTDAQGDVASLLSEYSSKAHCAVIVSGLFASLSDEIDLAVNATGQTAPTYIVSGTLDPTSRPADNAAYSQRLTDLSVQHVLKWYNGRHVYSGLSLSARVKIEAAINVWLKAR